MLTLHKRYDSISSWIPISENLIVSIEIKFHQIQSLITKKNRMWKTIEQERSLQYADVCYELRNTIEPFDWFCYSRHD